MKCICGYEYQNPDEVQGRIVNGNPEFISLWIAHFYQHITPVLSNVPLPVYACPKCGTLKINLAGGK